VTEQRPEGVAAGSDALRRFLAGEESLSSMLSTITGIATQTVPGCDAATITLLRDGGPSTPSYTSETARLLDETQYKFGDGPCLTAIRHRGIEHAATAAAGKWPEFQVEAARLGVLATLSVPLGNHETVLGALNMYSETTADYSEDARHTATLFADQLGVAAAQVTVYAAGYELAQQLREAMESRATIEQAKGILMAAQRCGPDEAFDILVRASQNQNRKLRAIADGIVKGYIRGEHP
jgi:GAF domain-containing protein